MIAVKLRHSTIESSIVRAVTANDVTTLLSQCYHPIAVLWAVAIDADGQIIEF
jgi:hypothetical protein